MGGDRTLPTGTRTQLLSVAGSGGPGHSPGGGALERAQRAQGRRTVRRLLDAGLAEFTERGFQAVTVDDIARRAHASHGTFYLYFSSKDDFFTLLAADALRAMDAVAAEFPVVTPNYRGKTALRAWVGSFCQTYASYATVFRTLSQADLVGRDVWQAGLDTLLRMADTIALGMIAGMVKPSARAGTAQHGRQGAIACLMMLERVNYLFHTGVQAPSTEMMDQLAAIIFVAFHAAERSAPTETGQCPRVSSSGLPKPGHRDGPAAGIMTAGPAP